MENCFLYFTPFYIVVLGLSILYITAKVAGNRTPKLSFGILTVTLLLALLSFFPFVKGFLKLSEFFEPMKSFIYFTPFENYNAAFLNGSMVFNPINVFFEIPAVLAGFVASILSFDVIKKLNQKSLQFAALILFGVLGAQCLAVSNDFLSLIISLEILSVSLIFLTTLVKNGNIEIEAGIKAFVLNAVTVCLMLFGSAIIYLHTGTLNFSDINIMMINSKIQPTAVLELGQIVFFAGLLGKAFAAPFVTGTLDILKGSNKTSFILLLSLLQTAVISALVKLIVTLGTYGGMLNFAFILFAAISLLISSLVAARTVRKGGSLKLFTASICLANFGCCLFSLAFFTTNAISAAVFALIISLVMNFALFAGFGLVLRNLKNREHAETISVLTGLSHISPFFASLLALVLLSIAGIPFTAGFISKFYIITEIARGGIWTTYSLLFAGLAFLLNIYACFKIITLIFKKPSQRADKLFKKPSVFNKLNPHTLTVSICAATLFALFILGGFLMNAIEAAI